MKNTIIYMVLFAAVAIIALCLQTYQFSIDSLTYEPDSTYQWIVGIALFFFCWKAFNLIEPIGIMRDGKKMDRFSREVEKFK